jgi:chloramphenicol O-acetyltransferase type B
MPADTSRLSQAFTKVRLANYIEKGFPIEIGRYTYGGPKLHWENGNFAHRLKIGSFCSIADNVGIFVGYHGRHPVDYISTYPLRMLFRASKSAVPSKVVQPNLSVIVGNDVWIGRDSLIMAGITIGNGAVVGARSLVNKDVPPYAIVGGSPARILKYRFAEKTIEHLLSLCWWDWEDDLLEQNMDLFSTPHFEAKLEQLIADRATS